MSLTRSYPIALGALLASVCATSCSDPGGMESAPGEEVKSTASAIVNGFTMTADQVNTWSMIGIYHRDGSAANAPWFPRPCSGVVAKIVNGSTYILTARHCVTTDHTVNGGVFANDALRVWSRPGLPLGTPPAEAIASSQIIPMPNPSGSTDYARDFAVVVVPSSTDFLPLVGYRKGLFVGNPSQLNGHEYTAFGYGVNDPTVNCGSPPYPSNGAGTARNAGPFVALNAVSSPPGGLYNFVNNNASGQWLNCGDSGGADIASYGPDDAPMDQIIGVHSTGMNQGSTRQSAMVTSWVQEQLKGVYVFSDFTGQALWANGSTANFAPAGSFLATAFVFYANTGQLKVNTSNQCLGLTFLGAPRFTTCSTSDTTQRWTVGWDRTIRNNNGQCLKALNSTQVTMQSCSFGIQPQQLWAITAHNG